MRIDLNCDLGEGMGEDAQLMRLITSANIACGGHAGDDGTMRATVALAQRHDVAMGAHPGFADRAHFGRRELDCPREEIVRLVTEQVRALQRLAPLQHVKPHGGLYTRAARDPEAAEAVAEAVAACNPALALFAPAGSELEAAGQRWGLRVVREVFADRRYQPDGQLVPRGRPGAVIDTVEQAAAQVLQMLREGTVTTIDGTSVAVVAETLCLHGDGPHAVDFARRLREELADAGVRVAAVAAK